MHRKETPRPLQDELEAMDIMELIMRIITDPSWYKPYRTEILVRSALQNKPIAELLRNYFAPPPAQTELSIVSSNTPGYQELPRIIPLDRILILLKHENRQEHVGEIGELLCASDWNFIDPNTNDPTRSAMRMEAAAARDFMLQRAEFNESWEQLSEPQRRTFWMICDAFARYARLRKGVA